MVREKHRGQIGGKGEGEQGWKTVENGEKSKLQEGRSELRGGRRKRRDDI